jgi:hypothetical protein
VAQLTIRTDPELVERVRIAASGSGCSMNEWVTLVLRAATDPDTEDREIARLRARLRLAGLLTDLPPSPVERPPADAERAAAARAGQGTPLSDLVREDRR